MNLFSFCVGISGLIFICAGTTLLLLYGDKCLDESCGFTNNLYKKHRRKLTIITFVSGVAMLLFHGANQFVYFKFDREAAIYNWIGEDYMKAKALATFVKEREG